MNKTLVLTLIGEDKPGLVESVSQLIAAQQGQWLDSQFSRLGGKFAGVLLLSVPADKSPALEQGLQTLVGLQVVIEEQGKSSSEPCYPLCLHFVGLDRRNIIADISTILSRFEVTVLSLSSHCAPAPMSAETLFHADFEVQVPLLINIEQLTDALEALTPELMVDLESYQSKAS